MSYTDQAVGAIHRQMRKKKITRGDIAEALGLHRVTVANYLNEPTRMPLGIFLRVLDLLEIDPRFMETYQTPPTT